ncbi:MAG: hypothetical protein M3R03_08835 [Pseudomonadota bacterium]|nr:hypothetical protein [Pseudomonadota bacterium]
MRKSELDAPTDPLPFNVPVICDRCRAQGIAGDPAFAAIPDILAFDPVPRRAHVNNWTAEHQRAFITALAITGSPRKAARALGRHSFGAEQLRSARGGRGFAAAWDAAMELARDREFARIHANLSDLAAQRDAELAAAPFAGSATSIEGRPLDPDVDEDGRGDYLDSIARLAHKMTMCRRLLLAAIEPDLAKRAAWEVLVGPVDWEKAKQLEAQADEPAATNPDHPEAALPNMRGPDMVLTAETGLLGEFTGGPDKLAEICEAIEAEDQAAKALREAEAELPAEERAALEAHRAGLIADGWIEDDDGNLWSPDPTA